MELKERKLLSSTIAVVVFVSGVFLLVNFSIASVNLRFVENKTLTAGQEEIIDWSITNSNHTQLKAVLYLVTESCFKSDCYQEEKETYPYKGFADNGFLQLDVEYLRDQTKKRTNIQTSWIVASNNSKVLFVPEGNYFLVSTLISGDEIVDYDFKELFIVYPEQISDEYFLSVIGKDYNAGAFIVSDSNGGFAEFSGSINVEGTITQEHFWYEGISIGNCVETEGKEISLLPKNAQEGVIYDSLWCLGEERSEDLKLNNLIGERVILEISDPTIQYFYGKDGTNLSVDLNIVDFLD